jgi:hypothetical protein
MPAFLDFHSMGRYTEDDLKKGQNPETNLELKYSIFFMIWTRLMFCLVDAPDRHAVEKHHSKFGIKCDWITPEKMTSKYTNPKHASK